MTVIHSELHTGTVGEVMTPGPETVRGWIADQIVAWMDAKTP